MNDLKSYGLLGIRLWAACGPRNPGSPPPLQPEKKSPQLKQSSMTSQDESIFDD